jgi:hypothetical protein
LIQEKTTDEVQQAMQQARTTVTQNLPKIAEVFATKATDNENPSVQHAKFLLDLFDWHAPSAAERKAKPEPASSEPAASDNSLYGDLMEKLDTVVREAEARAAEKAAAVK